MAFPIISMNNVWHIGYLDLLKKQKDSYEGSGLSVSTEPDAWSSISESTFGDLYELSKADTTFLDFYEISEEQKSIIIEWGIKEGYILSKTLYRYTFFNGDFDMGQCMDFETYEEALDEAGDADWVEEIQGHISTEKMKEEVFGEASSSLVFSLLCTIYGDKVLMLDGVWWDEELDEAILSAPRGVIFNSRLNEFEKTKTY